MIYRNSVAALVALICGCGAEGNKFDPHVPKAEIQYTKINCPSASTHSSLEKQVSVIENVQEFRELYIASNLDSQMPPPEVDFSENVVIALHPGAKPSAGYLVDVTQIYLSNNETVVEYEVISPTAACQVDTSITYPYCIIEVKKTGTPFVFKATQLSKCQES